MADDVIFVRRGKDLVSLAAASYEAEAVLQSLLEQHPQLLAGYQMSRGDPRRFLLVRREAPIPDRDGAAGRWSIDHLFLDQDAVPTLVEVKRSSDARIRREVVGQMLDYAANGTRYWGEGTLRQLFDRTCAEMGRDPGAVLEEVIGVNGDVDAFWVQAERNLRGGVLRLVFVADVIPDELRAVIEFLNARMHDTEVYGVEVRRYGDAEAGECFVPRLIGATAIAAAEKRPLTSLGEKMQSAGPEVTAAAERLRTLGEELGLPVVSIPASLRLCDDLGSVVLLYPTTACWSSPSTVCGRPGMKSRPPACGRPCSRSPGTPGRSPTSHPASGAERPSPTGKRSPRSYGTSSASEPRSAPQTPSPDHGCMSPRYEGKPRSQPDTAQLEIWSGGRRAEMYRVDITADLNDEDDTGYVWTFLDEARDPGQIKPGAIVIAGDQDAAAVCQVIDLTPAGDGTIVHLRLLPGLVDDYGPVKFPV
jgi:hypothetical protein